MAAEATGFRFAERGAFKRKVALASYPRSGNSLVRRLLEQVTGLFTGSDTRPDRRLSKELQRFGMKGEGVTDGRVWMVKTHYPERRGHRPFTCDRAIVVVRNPFDCIDSYFNMVLTDSHNASLEECQYARFAAAWAAFVPREVDAWLRFHNHWLDCGVPVLFVKYEDLIRPELRERAVRAMMRFCLAGTAHHIADLDQRVRTACASADRGRVYKPRSGVAGGSLRHFSPEAASAVLARCWHHLSLFSYAGLAEEVAARTGAALPVPPPPPMTPERAPPLLPPHDVMAAFAAKPSAAAQHTLSALDAVVGLDAPAPAPAVAPARRPPQCGPGSLAAALASTDAYLAMPSGGDLRVVSGDVVAGGKVVASFPVRCERGGEGSGSGFSSGDIDGDDDGPSAAAVQALLPTMYAGPALEVNMGYQLRPCTEEDPWGRGMRWREHVGITVDSPVRTRAKG